METPWWKFSSGRFFCFSLSLHFHYFSNKNIYLILNINFLISWIQAQQKKEARGNDDCCELLSNSLTLWIHHSNDIKWSVISLGHIVNGELPKFVLEMDTNELELFILEKLRKRYEERLKHSNDEVLLSDLEIVNSLISKYNE